jgi:DNA-binding LacI/PurR family transcriptional regulator
MPRRSRVRPSMRQVAEAAGVSMATASNALNGTGRLSETTRRRVLEAARELSYLPYNSARAAARGGVGLLGLSLATYGEAPVAYTQIPYYSQLILAATAAAHQRGYLLTVLPGSMSHWTWLTTPLDGVIHTEPRLDDPIRAVLKRRGIPIVYQGRPPVPAAGDAWVDSDVAKAVSQLLDQLAENGSRRVALVLPLHDDAYPELVRETYERWCQEHRQAALLETFEVPGEYPESELAAVHRLLERRPRPGAMVGIYSSSGHNILAAASAKRLRVPERLKVACISEDPAYATTSPPVTTVSLRPDLLGAEAVDLLLAIIDGRQRSPRQRLVDPVLHVRRSTMIPAAGAFR